MSAAPCCQGQDRRTLRADVLGVWNSRHETALRTWLELPWVPLAALLAARREAADVRAPLCARCYVAVREQAMQAGLPTREQA